MEWNIILLIYVPPTYAYQTPICLVAWLTVDALGDEVVVPPPIHPSLR